MIQSDIVTLYWMLKTGFVIGEGQWNPLTRVDIDLIQ